jgi:hypothetical protein
MAPRTENPMPAAMRVKKLAQKRILWLVLGASEGPGLPLMWRNSRGE